MTALTDGTERIGVLLVDDHAIVRKGVRALLLTERMRQNSGFGLRG